MFWSPRWTDASAAIVTICWHSTYAPFAETGIPEIQDFNVLPEFRRRGIGTRLMDRAEQRVARRCDTVGIGVGMYADYGHAQRLYVLRGYVPDGRGLTYRAQGTAADGARDQRRRPGVVLHEETAIAPRNEAVGNEVRVPFGIAQEGALTPFISAGAVQASDHAAPELRRTRVDERLLRAICGTPPGLAASRTE